MPATSLVSVLILLGAAAHGQAHVHGQAEASLTIGRDSILQVEFIAPAGDLVGFEHAPQSDVEHAALRRLEDQLAEPLVSLSPRAGCSFMQARVSGPGAEDHTHDDHAGRQQNHAHSDDEAHEGEHDHFAAPDSGTGSAHGNITVQWRFDCNSPDAVLDAEFGSIFEAFPSILRIEASAILGSRQPGFGVLTPQRSQLDLP
ncbi:ZrgA family zinc uptake protein [Marinicauda pacifica]|jgi:hypothetical protein|uniref:ZrgA family zinc uptake protein n=1 Tax=Marinicauda pacifica TaxID=1133559 RepID=UPI0035C7B5FE